MGQSTSNYRIRRATLSDAPAIARQRVAMFQEMGELADKDVAHVESETRERLAAQLSSGEYTGWLAEYEGVVVGGAGVLLHTYYPTAQNPRGRPTAYILNVYTDPGHRRQGIARGLLDQILQWCVDHDIPRASLHASEFGQQLYERMGFSATNEMRLVVGKRIRMTDET
jgi:GNAT superfamily N-acetyltransferase